MTLKIFLCTLFCCVAFSSYTQKCTYTFKGTITDYHDGTSLSGASVYLKKLNKYTISDDQGKFEFKNLCTGEIHVFISHISCESKELKINISEDTSKEFNLEHHTEELKEVTITSALELKTKTRQSTVLKSNVIDTYSSQNLGDVLKSISGVSSINSGNSIVKPMINGLHGSRVDILNNEVNIQDQQWGIEHAPSIDINSAENIYVIKGAGALQYSGSAIGGIIIAEPSKTLLKDSLYGKTLVFGGSNGKGGSIMSKLTRTYESGWFSTIQGKKVWRF